MPAFRLYSTLFLSLISLGLASCSGSAGDSGSSSGSRGSIRVTGSDTMVNLAQAWAENYGKTHPEVSIQVAGGGSGVGISGLINGIVDVANASRRMKPSEIARAKQKNGVEPREFIVGRDAVAVYVHKDNPFDSISIEELAEIYGDGAQIENWSQIGTGNEVPSGKNDTIVRVSRQNNSGTYHYFRGAVLGKEREYKLGSIDQSGSKDGVALVEKTPLAIGYSGMAYATTGVKMLKVSRKKGEPGVEPTVENAQDGSYPIARPLIIYTSGEPTGAVKQYLDWIRSEEGQKIVEEIGYVPVRSASDAP